MYILVKYANPNLAAILEALIQYLGHEKIVVRTDTEALTLAKSRLGFNAVLTDDTGRVEEIFQATGQSIPLDMQVMIWSGFDHDLKDKILKLGVTVTTIEELYGVLKKKGIAKSRD